MLLLDVQMPVMNGFETARAIRALLPDVRIVFASDNELVDAMLPDGWAAGSLPSRTCQHRHCWTW